MRQAVLAIAMTLTVSARADTGGAGAPAPQREQPQHLNQAVSTMRIQINIDGQRITATLAESATSRDFVSLLPLTLTLRDYASTEKISDLPRRLSTKGAPAGVDPDIGDIAYYAPWGNLAIYYKDFGYSDGLVRLGTIDSGIEALRRSGPIEVTIERGEQQ